MPTWAFDNSYNRLPDAFYTRQGGTALREPHLISLNDEVAALLGLPLDELRGADFLRCAAGGDVLPGMAPLAMKYAGHQFGSYNPALGDGRGLLLGQLRSPRGDNWDLHLKGSGQTPYSRQGDGRAVLRSCIREYLCGEAMAGLGIATTRTLCLVGSSEPVWRESLETAATTIRVAQSHVRFGHFEHFYYSREHQHLETLADYLIAEHYPDLAESDHPYLALFDTVIDSTAEMIAQWQAVGFAHGVMNTDNMSILGLTFDYGPYGFLEAYRPDHICNHSDHTGRYAFDQQPQIAMWNLSALGQALTPLIEADALNASLDRYPAQLRERYLTLMRAKLGLVHQDEQDGQLINALMGLMAANQPDYPLFFRRLADVSRDGNAHALGAMFADKAGWDAWLADYRRRLARESRSPGSRYRAMQAVNPLYVLRNHLAQQAITAAEGGDYRELETLLRLLKHPFDEQPGMADYAAPSPPGTVQPAISCSS